MNRFSRSESDEEAQALLSDVSSSKVDSPSSPKELEGVSSPTAVEPVDKKDSGGGITAMGFKVLALLAIQNCSKNIIMRAAVKEHPDFLFSAAVIGSEMTKLTLSILWIVFIDKQPISTIFDFLRMDWWNSVLLIVPASVYNLQQTLEYVALANVDAAIFSVLVQTKMLTTALFSVTLMRKSMRKAQVLSLILLTVGVMLCNIKCNANGAEVKEDQGNSFVGIAATLGIAAASGFAAVYTEKVIKAQRSPAQQAERSKYSLAYMQVQLASVSLVIMGAFAVMKDFSQIMEYGLWHNFNTFAFISVLNSGVGGLLVAAVLKFADSVLKGYATAVSVMLTGLLSMMIFGTQLSLEYLLGMVIVICSTQLYNARDLDVSVIN